MPANHVKGLLAAAVSAGQTPSEAIPVAKLLTPADGKSSKAKTPLATLVHKKKPEPGKTARAIEEPATESSLPPVVAKGSVPPPPPPPPPVPAPPLPVPPVAGVQGASEAAASPPAVPGLEAEPAMVPPGRHSPGIDLPFDVSPPTFQRRPRPGRRGQDLHFRPREGTRSQGEAEVPSQLYVGGGGRGGRGGGGPVHLCPDVRKRTQRQERRQERQAGGQRTVGEVAGRRAERSTNVARRGQAATIGGPPPEHGTQRW